GVDRLGACIPSPIRPISRTLSGSSMAKKGLPPERIMVHSGTAAGTFRASLPSNVRVWVSLNGARVSAVKLLRPAAHAGPPVQQFGPHRGRRRDRQSVARRLHSHPPLPPPTPRVARRSWLRLGDWGGGFCRPLSPAAGAAGDRR